MILVGGVRIPDEKCGLLFFFQYCEFDRRAPLFVQLSRNCQDVVAGESADQALFYEHESDI